MSTDAPAPYEPELGQLLFGNAAGELELGANERYVADKLYELSEALGRRNPDNQAHGFLGGEWGYGQEYQSDVFEMHPYWWGDCTCGFDEVEYDFSVTNPHSPTCFNARYQAEDSSLHALDMDYDSQQEQLVAWAKENGYPDAPYGMAVYCDCGSDARWAEWAETHQHEPDCREVLANFKCGDLDCRWYKYIGRGMSVNKQLSKAEWKALFKRCFDSLPPLDPIV